MPNVPGGIYDAAVALHRRTSSAAITDVAGAPRGSRCWVHTALRITHLRAQLTAATTANVTLTLVKMVAGTPNQVDTVLVTVTVAGAGASTFDVELTEPVEIDPGFWYAVFVARSTTGSVPFYNTTNPDRGSAAPFGASRLATALYRTTTGVITAGETLTAAASRSFATGWRATYRSAAGRVAFVDQWTSLDNLGGAATGFTCYAQRVEARFDLRLDAMRWHLNVLPPGSLTMALVTTTTPDGPTIASTVWSAAGTPGSTTWQIATGGIDLAKGWEGWAVVFGTGCEVRQGGSQLQRENGQYFAWNSTRRGSPASLANGQSIGGNGTSRPYGVTLYGSLAA